MSLLSDDEARQIEQGLPSTRDPGTLARWVRALLADRRARSGLLQAIARHLHHLHRRIGQAGAYLQGLAGGAKRVTGEPWAGHAPCPHCGAPGARAHTRASKGPGGHALVYFHPDGRQCTEEDGAGTRPRKDPARQAPGVRSGP